MAVSAGVGTGITMVVSASMVGSEDGAGVGFEDGAGVGFADGGAVGLADGAGVGLADGGVEGAADGGVEGAAVGAVVPQVPQASGQATLAVTPSASVRVQRFPGFSPTQLQSRRLNVFPCPLARRHDVESAGGRYENE